jgi:predicted RNA-binding protein associated with RNAse of E/G family
VREYIFPVAMAASVRIHYHRPDRGTTVFVERIVLDRSDVKVTLLDDYQGRDAYAGDQLILSAGAPVVWFVYPGLNRDVGRFHLADGTFTGWYTNLRDPIRMDGADWYCTDLFLDHWLPADGSAGTWLDEDELAAAMRGGLVDDAQLALVRAERATVNAELAAGRWPPPLASEIDLSSARTMVSQHP